MKKKLGSRWQSKKYSSMDHEIAVAQIISRRIGGPVDPALHSHLAKFGRGAFATGRRQPPEKAVDRWLEAALGWRPNEQDLLATCNSDTPETGDRLKPVWMVFGDEEDPILAGASRYIEAWGAKVERVTTALAAIRMATSGQIDGGLLNCAGRIEAAHFIIAQLMFRGLPYVALTDGREALGFDLGGVVVDRPVSIDEIRAGFESLPERKIWGLSFAAVPQLEATP
ncbi:hypothetical protein [Methylobacterium nigriterrae]|uniref:hypothetical protein n=1 Tax=Methylobacterium nigriterrae TaxID=3127512 RepID=UPI00301404DE